ncbi:hypothetical protein H0H92_001891 [Tricholoma furcatifolium]|nr:hypothetical protein H0H92_001891 [Tricholoma furcatifolium]
MSQRIAPREVMPTVDPNPPRIATVVDSLTSLSGDNSSFGFSIPANSDTQQFVIIAYGTDSPDSSDPSATLRQHYEFKTVLLDLSQGGTGTTTSGSAAPTKTSSTEHGTNPSDDIPLLPYQRMIVAHAIFCVVGFLLFLPSGALLARYLRTFTPTWFVGHTVAQFWLAGPTIIIGVSLGVKAVTTSGAMHLNDTHKRLGVAIFFLYFVQLILGAVIHWIKPRNTSRRPIQNYAHAVIGLLIIAMAMYQVHDGFQNEWPRTTGRETLSNGVSILYYIWIVGTMLEALTLNAKSPLWSTQPILDNPRAVVDVHLAFLRAGAQIIMTSTYQASFETFKKAGFSDVEARETMLKSVHLANEARSSFEGQETTVVKIALSLGPFGATLSPPQEFGGFYPPPYGPMGYSEAETLYNTFDEDTDDDRQSILALTQFHLERLLVFARDPETWKIIDIVAFETVPLLREAVAIRHAMLALKDTLISEGETFVEKPWWISFVFPGGKFPQRSREDQCPAVCDVVQAALEEKLLPVPTGIGINCTAPEFIYDLSTEFTGSVEQLQVSTSYHPWLVLYPDGGDVFDAATRSWMVASADKKDAEAVSLKKAVHAAEQCRGIWDGVVVGGCCRTGPDFVERVARQFSCNI